MSKFLIELITNPMDRLTFQNVKEDIEDYLDSGIFESTIESKNVNIFVNQTRIVLWCDLFGENLYNKLTQFIPSLIRGIESPNQMRWSKGSIAFFSPIINILSFLDEKLINIEIEGVKSTDCTLIDLHERVQISSIEDYFKKMDKIVGFNENERKTFIKNQINRLAASLGKKFINDSKKVEQISKTIENPSVIGAKLDEVYYSLPEEFLYNIINKYDACVPLRFEDDSISEYFVIVYNKNKDKENIRKQYQESLNYDLGLIEEVFEDDLKLKLKDYVPRLNWITKYEQLGNLYDKTNRIKMIVSKLADSLSLAKEMEDDLNIAADLSKADLATRTVKKYPQLRGIVAKTMLSKEGYDDRIGEAIVEQYLPGTQNLLPSSPIGFILAISDKFDDVLGLLISENYNLRMIKNIIDQILNLLINSKLEVDLETLINIGLYVYTEESIGAFDYNKLEKYIMDLFIQRYKNILRNLDIKAELINDYSLDMGVDLSTLTEGLLSISNYEEDDLKILSNLIYIGDKVLNTDSHEGDGTELERDAFEKLCTDVRDGIDGKQYLDLLRDNKDLIEDLNSYYESDGEVTEFTKKLFRDIRSRWI